jgi:hypothetical protein
VGAVGAHRTGKRHPGGVLSDLIDAQTGSGTAVPLAGLVAHADDQQRLGHGRDIDEGAVFLTGLDDVGDAANVRKYVSPQYVGSFAAHGPTGPWITTSDEIPDPGKIELCTYVNGEERQAASTGDMVFSVPEMIEHLSTAFTLEPGDLLFTGSPEGVGLLMKPPRFLNVGDRDRVEIEGLGVIENEIIAEPTQPDR